MQWLFALVLLTVGQGPAPAVPGVCEWMSGGALAPVGGPFAAAAEAAGKGDFGPALEQFVGTARALESKAQKLFFDGEAPNAEAPARFMEQYVRGENPVLAVRGDRFALRPDLVAWGAWLACRAGDGGQGIALLKSGWRDYAKRQLKTDAAFLFLATGEPHKARDFLEDSPKDGPGAVAMGLIYCAGDDKERGRKWLEYAGRKVTDESGRTRLEKLRQECL